MRAVRRARRRLIAAAAAALFAGAPSPAAADAPAPVIPWRLVAAYPHDPQAFTQGLLLHDGVLYESTGLRGRSELRAVDPASGRVLRRRPLDPTLFGEGLARVGEHLYQLTWQAGRVLVYRIRDLHPVAEHRYPGEGWGLAFDGRRLLMSDGSDRIRVLDPADFGERASFRVHDGGEPVPALNELEFAEGRLYANVWQRDRVARIDPASGRVTGWLDFSGLLGPAAAGAEVLNGLAWDAEKRQLWVTGKLWPRMFVVEMLE